MFLTWGFRGDRHYRGNPRRNPGTPEGKCIGFQVRSQGVIPPINMGSSLGITRTMEVPCQLLLGLLLLTQQLEEAQAMLERRNRRL
jgi:hypothetical protein